MTDNSPTFQGWVRFQKPISPGGTAEFAASRYGYGSRGQPALQDLADFRAFSILAKRLGVRAVLCRFCVRLAD
jgi:hypothetical protein